MHFFWRFDHLINGIGMSFGRDPKVAVNDGSCKRGFVKNLVNMAAEVVPALKITCDDINNKMRRIRDPPEQQQ